MTDPHKNDVMKKLEAFSAKHRPSFATFGIYAFDVNVDITRCMREVIFISVAPNPGWDGKRAETAFLAFQLDVVPLEFFGERQGEEIRGLMKTFHEEQRRIGNDSGFMVVLSDRSAGVSNACGVGFRERSKLADEQLGRRWKESMMLALNTGKVF